MRRVLFLTQVLPYPLDSGAKIRAYHVLRRLAADHEVTLVSFVRLDDAAESVAHLRCFCQAVHTVPMRRSALRNARAVIRSLLRGIPVVIARDEIEDMCSLLQQLVRDGSFDVVHADQTSMAQYALWARLQVPDSHSLRPRLVLDAHNTLYRIPDRMARYEPNPVRRAFLRREAAALRRYELDAYGRFDHVVFVTDLDCEALSQGDGGSPGGDARCTIIPICVDPEQKPLVQRRRSARGVTHLGTMFWPPNVEGVLWFARSVWPRVVDRVPKARLAIVGKNPPVEIRDLPNHLCNVDVTGYVPDPVPYLAETAVFLVPLRAGGGMRVKILDAWCWGVPIVSTSIGAEGIEIQEGKNILIADTPEALADAVVHVLMDPALGDALRENGRHWVEERYDWRRVYHEWDRVYGQLD
jgi:glycosyltransferase involved in cell wall biosynthesis